MAARSIASLTVSFGLVSIPVKLYSATQPGGAISFNLLHTCGSRLKQQYVCAKEEVVVPREEMVKGYEFAKDQYVVFTPEELKALEEASSRAVEITEFVPIESIDPVFFDKAYYLAPDKGGAKAYGLLAKALRESNRCAVGRWASRGKQYIVMLRPIEQGLVMQQLLYATEVRPIEELEIPDTAVKEPELKLARQLIEQQSTEGFDPTADTAVKEPELKLARQLIEQQSTEGFDPTAYTDEVRERIDAMVQKKVEGQEIAVSEEAPAGGAQIIDLMEALRESLKKKAPAPAKEAPARKPPKRVQHAAAERKAAKK